MRAEPGAPAGAHRRRRCAGPCPPRHRSGLQNDSCIFCSRESSGQVCSFSLITGGVRRAPRSGPGCGLLRSPSQPYRGLQTEKPELGIRTGRSETPRGAGGGGPGPGGINPSAIEFCTFDLKNRVP